MGKNDNLALEKLVSKSVREAQLEEFRNGTLSLLLDYSLISQTNQKNYDVKIIQSGKYLEIYQFERNNLKKDSDLEKIKKPFVVRCEERKLEDEEIKIINERKRYNSSPLYKHSEEIEEDIVYEREKRKSELKQIELKNINRSKYQMQRIVQANEEKFKTFITLTFEENLKDIEEANKKFNSFRTYLKKYLKQKEKEFYYVCVPEFQKRGAVHYHLLTNIDYKDFDILEKKEKKLWSRKKQEYEIFRIFKKSWSHGFSQVKPIEDDKIVGYLNKYMTKDIDNRLWGKRRYFYSQNLQKSCVIYLNLNNKKDFNTYLAIDNISDEKYNKLYYDTNDEFVNYTVKKINDKYYDFIKNIKVEI